MFLITNVTFIFNHSIYEVLVLDIRYQPNIKIMCTDQTTYWELKFDDNLNIAIATQAPTELSTTI
jgi:hypothetical protein